MASPSAKDIEAGSLRASSPPTATKGLATAPELSTLPVEADTPLGKVSVYVRKIEQYLVKYNLEARGLQRVQPHESQPVSWMSYIQAFRLWLSINLAANNITLGMLGPAIFGLSFKHASLCAVFGSILGSIPVAHIATFGPLSGNRTLVFARYTFGWWPVKLLVILNIMVQVGYSMIDLVIAGQILSAVSVNGNLSIVVGIIIVGLVCWAISTFGIQIFHAYQRYAWLPQIIAVSILYGVSSSHFDLTTPSQGDPKTVIGNRISFFSLCLSAAITWSGISADFFVYYSPQTSRPILFLASLLGLTISFTFAFVAGIGLATGTSSDPSYSAAYTSSQGSLIVTALSNPLGAFGKFLAIIILFSLVANTIGPSYSIGIDFQLLTSFTARVPRFVWNTAGVIIYTVCALAGRAHLSEIFTNFLALMGYWVAIWVAVQLEEQLLFRRRRRHGVPYDWTCWNDHARLPVGLAALASFLIGWAGAILCMSQVWYVGPIARRVGDAGADMGNYVGFSWAALVYPPLRWLELKKFGR